MIRSTSELKSEVWYTPPGWPTNESQHTGTLQESNLWLKYFFKVANLWSTKVWSKLNLQWIGSKRALPAESFYVWGSCPYRGLWWQRFRQYPNSLRTWLWRRCLLQEFSRVHIFQPACDYCCRSCWRIFEFDFYLTLAFLIVQTSCIPSLAKLILFKPA